MQRMPRTRCKQDEFHAYLQEAKKAAEALGRLVSAKEKGMLKDDNFVDDMKRFISGCETGRRLLKRQSYSGG